MPALFEMLGMAQQAWCCPRAQNGPPIQTAVADPAPDDPQLRPFFQVCGACHRSDEPFPPNFLAGTARQARSTLGHCAERIQYRLAMWDLGPNQRAKSPMPPQHADSMDHAHLEQWLTGLLPELRRALGEIAADDAEPLPSRREVTARPYSTLRRCLPAS